MTNWNGLYSDPQFQSLPYSKQQEVIGSYVAKDLGNDPQFQALDMMHQQDVFKSVMQKKVPAFSNPLFQQWANSVLSSFLQAKQNLDSQDPQVKAHAEAVMKQMRDAAINIESARTSGFARATMNILDSSGISKVLGFTQEQSIKQAMPLTKELLYGKDAQKFVSYLNFALQDSKQSSSFQTAEALSNMLGVAGDVALLAVPAGKLGKALEIIGAARAARSTTSVGRWLFSSALPQFGRITVEGLAQTFADYYRNNEDVTKTTAAEFVKKYSMWAGLDYLIGMGTTVALPFLKGATRALFRRSPGSWKNINEADVPQIIEGLKNGTIDPTMLEQMPQKIQDKYWMDLVGSQASKHIDALSPTELAVMDATSSRAIVRQLDNGQWRLTTTGANGQDLVTLHDDIVSVQRKLANLELDKISKAPADALDLAQQADPGFVQIAKTQKNLEGIYTPAKGKVGFVDVADRPYVSRAEADQLAANGGKNYQVLDLQVDPARFDPKTIKQNYAPVDVAVGGEKNAIVAVSNEASAQEVASAAKLAQEADPAESLPGLRDLYLQKAGYDFFKNPDGSVHLLYPDQVKLVSANVNPATGKIGGIKTTLHAAGQNPVRVQAMVRQELKVIASGRDIAKSDQMMVDVLSNFHGDVNNNLLQRISQMYLGENGVDVSKLSVKTKSAADIAQEGMVYARMTGDKIEISVPKAINTAAEQKQFIKELMDEFQNVIQSKSKNAVQKTMAKGGNAYADIYQKGMLRYVPEIADPIQREAWIKSVVRELGGTIEDVPKQGLRYQLPGQPARAVGDYEELLGSLVLDQMDAGMLKSELARKGYRLYEHKDSFGVRGPGIKGEVTATTPQELAKKIGYVPEKLDSRFAPKIADVSGGNVTFEVTSQSALGTRKDLLGFFNKFENKAYVSQLRHLKSNEYGDLIMDPAGPARVDLPGLGATMEFDTMAEAQKFINGGWKDLSNIQRMAKKKGLTMSFENGNWIFDDGKILNTAKTQESAYAILKSYPDAQDGVPDIIGALDPEVAGMERQIAEYQALVKKKELPILGRQTDLQPESFDPKPMPGYLVANAYITNMTDWTENLSRTTGDTAILGKYRNMENMLRFATGKSHSSTMLLDRIMRPGGKLLKKERRQAIFYFMGAQNSAEIEAAAQRFGALTDQEKNVVTNLRGLYDVLGKEFGIDPQKLIYNYMPRIRRYADAYENSALVNEAIKADELTQYVFTDGIPKEVKFWAEEDRISEMLHFAADDDAYSVTMKYINQGYKKAYLNEPWKDLHKELQLRVKSGTIDSFALDRFNRYRELVMGTFRPETQIRLEHMGQLFMQKMVDHPIFAKMAGQGRLEEKAWQARKAAIIESGQNLPKTMFSLNYFGSMGWRWWLAMRNNFQVWVTLAPRFGIDATAKAVKFVEQAGPEFYDYLMHLGVISGQAPVVTKLLANDTWIGKMTESSLKMFKNSDEYTRAIAYAAAKIRWDDAVSAWQRGVIGKKSQFFDISGLDMIQPDIGETAWQHFQKGTAANDAIALSAGRDTFAAKVTQDTMFGYRASESPMINHSFLGKLFGQYGTFAAGYRANIFNGLRYGSKAKKLAFVGRFLGINAALYTSFAAIGINATDFIPFAPGLFSGGPMFQTAVDIMQMFGTNASARDARARVERALFPVTVSEAGTPQERFKLNYPGLMPGTIQWNYLKKAYDFALQGDSWSSWLSLSTIPVRKDGPLSFQ